MEILENKLNKILNNNASFALGVDFNTLVTILFLRKEKWILNFPLLLNSDIFFLSPSFLWVSVGACIF